MRTAKPQFRPGFVEPCIPTPAGKIPDGPLWVHELKHDGYRLIIKRQDDRVRLFTRGGYDWTDRYPRIVQAVRKLRVKSFVIDGEAVICDRKGRADFDKLHARGHDADVTLYAFDLLELDGNDWAVRDLEDRKDRLARLLKHSQDLRYNPHFEGDGGAIFKHACKLGLEGIVSKRRDLPYRPGPSKSWVKIKNPKSPAMLRVKEGTF
jgi:ATP-dependent DNA ligase